MASDRYQRQSLLPQIGDEGQRRLSASRIVLIGCGALGTVLSEQLVRAGVGALRICDRDLVELTNLQRQTLFDESDARASLPKSIAAARRLTQINSETTIEPLVVDVHSGNIEEICNGADVILDGTDNVATRYLINDVAVKQKIDWVYGACVGTEGRVMSIVPGTTPCLRCIFPEPPAPGELPTCDTAGVLSSAAGVAASVQAAEAIKLLISPAFVTWGLLSFDVWSLRFKVIETDQPRPDCIACGRHQFDFLDRAGNETTTLCGRNTVQVRPAKGVTIDLSALASRLTTAGAVQSADYFVRCALRERALTLTVFPDARALIHGTSDPAVARSIYARYIGS